GGALRQMDVDVELVLEVAVDAQLVGSRSGVGERGVRRLLHHVASPAGDPDTTVPRHGRHLDGDDLAADLRRAEPDREPDLAATEIRLESKPPGTEELLDPLLVDVDGAVRIGLAAHDHRCHLAEQLAHGAVETANTCLASVGADDV